MGILAQGTTPQRVFAILKPLADGTSAIKVTKADGTTAVMTFDTTNSRVGIGLTPNVPLDVYGICRSNRIGGYAKLQYVQVDGGDSTANYITAQTADGADKPLYVQKLSATATPTLSNNIQFRIGTTASPSTKMTIYYNGNIGIGIIAPTAKLHVVGSSDIIQTIIKGNATQTANLMEWQNSGGKALLKVQPDGDLEFVANNIVTDTTTGTKIGTATGQKLGFWNATPVVQQVFATGASHTVDELITLLQTLGLCKQS